VELFLFRNTMIKAKQLDVKDSNIAGIGTKADKDERKMAASKEEAWKGAGQKLGLQIWRIEKFHVKAWPEKEYGKFYAGDSYIILRTYKKDPKTAVISWDIHFWLGDDSSQDEMGTAAYKTVELDDLLNDAGVQHRETQDHESDLFKSYFPHIIYMQGGFDSGFHHVTADKYEPHLLQVQGKKHIHLYHVDIGTANMNHGDVFILDCGLNIWQWNGKNSPPMERNKAAGVVASLKQEREGKPTVKVIDDGDNVNNDPEFWKLVGDPAKIQAQSVPKETVESKPEDLKLFRLSDKSGKMDLKQEGAGKLTYAMLDHNDVFIIDDNMELFIWIGSNAPNTEKQAAMKYAEHYIAQTNRPTHLPVTLLRDGNESALFQAILSGKGPEAKMTLVHKK